MLVVGGTKGDRTPDLFAASEALSHHGWFHYPIVFDRAIVTYHIRLSCEAMHHVQIMQEALMKRQLFNQEANV